MQASLNRVKELSSALQFHDMSEKQPKKSPKSPKNLRNAHHHPETKHRAVSWVRWLKSKFGGHLVHPQAPTFCGFQASESPNETTQTPVPVVTWCSRRAARPAHGGGHRWVHQGPRGKKIIFSKVVPRPLGMLKQVFLGRFEPVVTRFGPWKSQNAL